MRFILEQDLPRHVFQVGARLRDGLEKLRRSYPRIIGDVRGMGLMQGLELVKDETAGDRTPNPDALAGLFEATRKRGLLVGKGGLYGNVIRIAPPMTVTAEQIEHALSILEESFDEISRG
jgi:4-aminobutyrate aminotransferase-like enzyme